MTAKTRKKPTAKRTTGWKQATRTGAVILADGTIMTGFALGVTGTAVGEVCFNTSITGYQEIMTDPSYAGQIITFTFPHIGNTGTNIDDNETTELAGTSTVKGAIFKAEVTDPSNYRATGNLQDWLLKRGLIAVTGIDTRALTALIRKKGMPNAVIAHSKSGKFNFDKLIEQARAFAGLEGMDLARQVSCSQSYQWDETLWDLQSGYGRLSNPEFKVVVMDFGIKKNILRCLASVGCKSTVVPANTSAEEILAMNPDGIFLSNGPGDPAATGEYAVPEIKKLIDSGKPVFGICLGHQMMALALGGKTVKMHQGHHGANHPVKDHTTGKVEITSMNHGFAVDGNCLPQGVSETHTSLFDGSNCGIALADKPVFSVQHHPEASPGPQDSHYLFQRFAENMRSHR